MIVSGWQAKNLFGPLIQLAMSIWILRSCRGNIAGHSDKVTGGSPGNFLVGGLILLSPVPEMSVGRWDKLPLPHSLSIKDDAMSLIA